MTASLAQMDFVLRDITLRCEMVNPSPSSIAYSSGPRLPEPRISMSNPRSKTYTFEDRRGPGGLFSTLLLDALVLAVISLGQLTFRNVKMH